MSTALRCCVTQKEVERYVELFHGKEQSAINTVNAQEQNPWPPSRRTD